MAPADTAAIDPGVLAADDVTAAADATPPGSPGLLRRLGVVFILSVGWIVLIVLAAVLADVLPIKPPDELGIRTGEIAKFEPPGANAWFGGDAQGKDIFSNVVHGARPALLLGLIVTAVAATVGGLVGMLAAFIGGRADAVAMTLVEVSLAFPGLILLVTVSAIWGNGLWLLIALLSMLSVAPYVRVVRSVTLTLVRREFVDAARSMGATRRRILLRELAPNVMLPAMSLAFIGFAIVIATEGALAFVGLSLDRPSWGNLIRDGSGVIRDAPHVALIPATVMFITILAFNFVADGVRTIADPRTVVTGRRTLQPTTVEPPEAASDALLSIRNLRTRLVTPLGIVEAVDDVSLDLAEGRTLGVVGESGSGKTMLVRSILGAFPLPDVHRSGRVVLGGTDLLTADDRTLRRVLGTEIGTVFQNPLTALNPVRTVGSQITETMRVHRGVGRAAARRQAIELLGQVGIPEPSRRIDEYPHQLSGGMRQRVTIAVALANEPRLLLADEPTTALDVTVQDQILNLLGTLCDERGMALVLITHDLSVIRGWTDDVAVMYGGRIVESGPTDEVLAAPRHRYTAALLESIPRLDLPAHHELAVIDGAPPPLIDPPIGCRFAPRCAAATPECTSGPPGEITLGVRSHHCLHPVGAEEASVGR